MKPDRRSTINIKSKEKEKSEIKIEIFLIKNDCSLSEEKAEDAICI